MSNCYECKIGTLDDGFTTMFVYRDGRFLSINFVPSLVCLRCGFNKFSDKVFNDLQSILMLDAFIRIMRYQPERREFDYLYVKELSE